MTVPSFNQTDEPPLCPQCKRKCWRAGHMVRLLKQLKDGDMKDAAVTACMWCSACWVIEFAEGQLQLRELTKKEWEVAGEILTPAAHKLQANRIIAEALGIPLEEFLALTEIGH